MKDNTLKLYQSAGSPNSRRVRIFLAEKGLEIPLIPVDLGKGEQHSDAYRAINPRRVVPTLVLEDGTSIGEVPAILRYIEEIHPQKPLHGETAKERALTTMWERGASSKRDLHRLWRPFAIQRRVLKVARSPVPTTMIRSQP